MPRRYFVVLWLSEEVSSAFCLSEDPAVNSTTTPVSFHAASSTVHPIDKTGWSECRARLRAPDILSNDESIGPESVLDKISDLSLSLATEVIKRAKEQIIGLSDEQFGCPIVIDADGALNGSELSFVVRMNYSGLKGLRLMKSGDLIKHLYNKGFFGRANKILFADKCLGDPSHKDEFDQALEYTLLNQSSISELPENSRSSFVNRLSMLISGAHVDDWFEVEVNVINGEMVYDRIWFDGIVEAGLKRSLDSDLVNAKNLCVACVGLHADYTSSFLSKEYVETQAASFTRESLCQELVESKLHEIRFGKVDGQLSISIDGEDRGELRYSSMEPNRRLIDHTVRLFGQKDAKLMLTTRTDFDDDLVQVEFDLEVTDVLDVVKLEIEIIVNEYLMLEIGIKENPSVIVKSKAMTHLA